MIFIGFQLIEIAVPFVIFSSGFLTRKFISDRKNEKVFVALLKLIESLLEKFEVSVPEFLRELLQAMQNITEETSEFENIVKEEIESLTK